MGLPDVDYRALYGKEYLGSWDLPRDVTLTIARVEQGELRSAEKKKADKRPIVYFEKTDKALVLNSTTGKTIAGMYGNRVRDWIGKRITIYATTCEAFGKTVDCIRVRPKVPAAKTPNTAPPSTAGIPSKPIDGTAEETGSLDFDPGAGEVAPEDEFK